MYRITLAVIAAISSIGTAQAATTIGFQPLALATAVPVTYIESGFTIQSNSTRVSASGFVSNTTLSVQKAIGSNDSGIPSVNFLRSTSFSLTGGTFTFDGLSAFFGTSNGVSNSFTVVGSLLDKEIYKLDFTATGGSAMPNNAFRLFDTGNTAVLDKLIFTSGAVSAQLMLDDIRVSAATVPTPDPVLPSVTAAVPEPASWAMMLLGFGVVGATMRRPRNRVGVAGSERVLGGEA